jgi:hypothetical protein
MRRLWKTALVLALLVFVLPAPAFSQGCALCYTQAAGGTARFIQALRSGILILIIPPMLMSVAISVLAYRKRHQFSRQDSELERNW